MHRFKVGEKVVRIIPDGTFGANAYHGIVTCANEETVKITFLCDVWRSAEYKQFYGTAQDKSFGFIMPLVAQFGWMFNAYYPDMKSDEQ